MKKEKILALVGFILVFIIIPGIAGTLEFQMQLVP